MKVSLINLNLVEEDAIGSCIVNQVRFFRRRGDDVRVYVMEPPRNVPADVAAATRVVRLRDLIGGQEEHFSLSDLTVYHYPSRHELMESIRGIDRGTVIFYYHNVTPPELWGSDADRETLIKGVEGAALAHYADVCITPSPFNKQDLVERVGCDPDRVYVLPLAVPLAHFTPGDKDPQLLKQLNLEGRRVLLFVGRMAGNKRIDLLVEALAIVQRQAPGTRLLLVGDDRGSPVYAQTVAAAQARAVELGMAGDAIWTGQVADLLPYYRLADVYVTASLHEGFGVPLIEAMACGLPVVASKSAAMPWVLACAGLLFEPGNAQDLAEKTLAVLQDANLRGTLVERGLERVQQFSLEAYEAGLGEIVDMARADRLPRLPVERIPAQGNASETEAAASYARDAMFLSFLAGELERSSDIAQRGYVVRSRAPLIGPLIAWVRRNLTSHLREPYLDPTIERQVAFNHQVAEWVHRAAGAWEVSARRQAELEARVQELEREIQVLAEPGKKR